MKETTWVRNLQPGGKYDKMIVNNLSRDMVTYMQTGHGIAFFLVVLGVKQTIQLRLLKYILFVK